jgi:hypothetical protein
LKKEEKEKGKERIIKKNMFNKESEESGVCCDMENSGGRRIKKRAAVYTML